MADHRFSKREYAISCIFTLVFTMLVSASYFDIATCPYNSQGGSALLPSRAVAPRSIFDSTFVIVPCHTLDLVVWIYVFMFTFFMIYKWFMYKAQQYHYFMLDYCYFHNACLCALVVYMLVKVEWVGVGLGSIAVPIPMDVVPVSTAVGSLTSDKLSVAMLLFFVILAGTFGPILGAILMWKNALVYHSFDKMISCYLHLAPAAVQGLVLHAALSSVKLRPSSRLRDYLRRDTNFSNLLLLHTAMFLAWQLVYHVFHEVRLYSRIRAYEAQVAKRKLVKDSAEALSLRSEMVDRTTAYTWMIVSPPMGKSGPLYRLVTMFGLGRFPSTAMFAVTQWLIHVVFFALGFVPLYIALIVYESAGPLMLYTCLFAALCIYNAAALNKSWIKKLQAKADNADALKIELDALKKILATIEKLA